ncbi:MAG: hypothetical protein JEZ12_09345 [Desulfobacterium sp.]|nr:hypothetical protein [Desulfobacterium sp.]
MEKKSRSMEVITYVLTAEDTGPAPGKEKGHWAPAALPVGAGIIKVLFWYLVSIGIAVALAAL